ncbi:endolytic transglycosylase MltG [Plantactinospora sp. B5E13]|uniref:endolytic transglycosylase MltG n=1 Tax=unclassified Plantactinospora TaxID=2631981 RepID=UPI00325EB694
MIDDFAFDEDMEKGRHRPGAQRKRNGKKKKKRKSSRGRTVAALLMAFVLLGVLGGVGWYGFDRVQGYFITPDYDGNGSGEVRIQIAEGESLAQIAGTLVEAGVVKSTKAFIEAADENSRSQNIQPGLYKVRKEMSAALALTALLDPKNKVTNLLTIPEGHTAKWIFKKLSEHTKIPIKDFEAAAKDPEELGVPDFWFKRSDGKKATKSIEGFLFPDTYDFPPNSTAEGVLKKMVQGFLNTAEEIDFVKTVETKRGGITPYEALIVASLAQAEAGVKKDLGKISRVAYNRLYGDFPCNCLQFDVTLNYYWELTGEETKKSGDLNRDEMYDEKNPYSTHAHAGLPPTPIDNPGKDALEGAMDPPKGNWLYFVAIDKDGNSAFADNYNDQLRNEAKARENGVL